MYIILCLQGTGTKSFATEKFVNKIDNGIKQKTDANANAVECF